MISHLQIAIKTVDFKIGYKNTHNLHDSVYMLPHAYFIPFINIAPHAAVLQILRDAGETATKKDACHGARRNSE